MANRRRGGRRVKIHRTYTVDEAARMLGVGKPTVRRWIKVGGLPALSDRKPWLIQGGDLEDFLTASRAPRQKCAPDECYCVKCRKPQKPACGMAEFVPLAATGGNLRAICPACETFMHKRISRATLPALSAILDISLAQDPPRLIDRAHSSLNTHLE